ncbi:hypothetical protein Gogos_011948 [Gossypium gossypioides]|uniref:Uncharacterized protein n=1 Tax=Gossypium gossypioides TaxID=34282 RepID=A0A7J9BR03_GOSGO|nr:hypothetical protein [Gossypium gossypioides]
MQGLLCEGLAIFQSGLSLALEVENMEQKKISSSSSSSNNNAVIRDEDEYKGVPIHSQVMKIKQEFEKIKHPSLQQPDMRRVLREITRQRSRSPLGLAERPISVGNS